MAYLDEFQLENNVDPPKSLLNGITPPYWLLKRLRCMSSKVVRKLGQAETKKTLIYLGCSFFKLLYSDTECENYY